ncbi:MAG: PEP-CTERM sorting domain-containing protein [Chthonomonas sp.]|nr:PEP-CTERM sorting domain-containing protein [Chthonomonas sp.]
MRGLTLLFVASLAGASYASIINGGFESPALGSGLYNTLTPAGWSSNGTSGVWNIPTGGFFAAEAPEGTQIGYSNGSVFAQGNIGILAVDQVTLSCMAGRRSDTFAGSFKMQLWAGGALNSSLVMVGGTLLGEAAFDHTSIAPATFTPLSVVYTAPTSSSLIGQSLTVRLEKTVGSQMNFDDFRINAVPEPGSLAALAIGALLLRARKK